MKIKPIICWYDFYMGFYWSGRRNRLYVLILPMIGFYIQFKSACTCEIYKRTCNDGRDKLDYSDVKRDLERRFNEMERLDAANRAGND